MQGDDVARRSQPGDSRRAFEMSSKHLSHKATAVYARTLFELAEAKSQLAPLKDEIEAVLSVFDKTPMLRSALQSPALSSEKKLALMKPLSDKASDLFKRFLRLLEIKGRLALLRDICEEFLRLEEEKRNVLRARVVSALPLSADQLQRLASGLSARRPGKTYLLHNEVDASLIAGFRVEEDDVVTDASLSHKLNALRQKLAA